MFIRFSLMSSVFVTLVSGTCNWPDAFVNTVWQDSTKGEIEFTTDKLSGWTIKITGASGEPEYDTWRCHSTALYESDDILVMITEDTFAPFGRPLYGYICLTLTEITQFSYRYYLNFVQQSAIDNERAAMLDSDSREDWGLICSLDDLYASSRPAESEYRVILKSNNLESTKIDCPFMFLGSYDYTHTSSDGTVTCDTSSDSLSTCTESTEISFDYTTCSTKVAYSVSDTVWCVDTVPSGGNNYVTVYNGRDGNADINNGDVFRFACFAFSDDGTMASVAPNSCRKDQTPDAFPTEDGNNIGATLTFSKSSESCLTCPLLNAPDSGSVSYSTNGAVTTASYSCSSQYSLAGPDTRTCQGNNTWADEEPTCTCIVPSQPANGSFVVSVDGTLTYSCDVGFVLNGDRTRNCQTDSNTWSGVEPSCDPCAELTQTTGLNVTSSTTGTTTISYFTCMAGYTMDGSSNTTCLQSGLWDTDSPTCIQCDSVTDTGTRIVDITTDGYTSTASFTCVTGYHIVGQDTATCNNDGTWDNIPTCECDEQAVPADGSREGNGTSAQFTCDIGYNLIGSSETVCLDDGSGWNADPPSCSGCTTLATIDGGFHNFSTDGLVTLATYSCKAGYSMSGQRLSYCQNDGSWNGTAPTCIQCLDLTDPSSGTVSIDSDGVTSSAHYACATGYDISGDTTSTCMTDGTWTNSPPTCSCSPASVPDNGVVLSDNGEAVYYQCNLNYSMNGTSVRDCATDGTGWSGNDPICVPCESLISVIGGSFVSATDGVNTKVQYSCDVGYTIIGKKEITCNSDGTWDSDQSSCSQCSTLTTPSGGNFTMYSDGDIITKATFTCDVGYVIDGYSELTCEDTGQWDNNVPNCVVCTSRNDPTSGNLTLTTDGQTTTGTYSCVTGYEIVGQDVITCRIDGNWNYPSSECKCLSPTPPTNGSVVADGDTVTFTCNTGFTMAGDNTGTCNTDGTGWSIATPQCVECASLANFTSGDVTYTSDGSTTVVEYSCPEGSSLQGSAVVSCSVSGTWQEDIPACVSCPSLPSVSVTTGSVTIATNGTLTTAEYNCPQGYEVKGSPILTCNSNGSWSEDPSDCVCVAPSVPEGGGFTTSEDGLSVTFTCGEGYSMDGVQTIACDTEGSGWELEYPNCTKCEDLTTPANGNITLVTSGTQTTAVYSCGVGYTLDGTAEPTCQSDGTWTTVEQNCVYCPDLPTITVTGGSVSLETNGTTTTAVYSCPAGYEVSGPQNLTCNSSGSWDNSPSTCVCEPPDIPDGGSYILLGDGLNVTFSCDEGYTMNGVQEVTCATDGSGWMVTFPNCTQCGSISAPNGGNLELVTDGIQTVALYTCDVGSSIQGEAVPECQPNGTWSATEPTCVSCPSLPPLSVTVGNVSFVTNGTTTTAEYNCPEGYEVKGTQTLTCSPDGSWSDSPSDCVCETPSTPEGGNFTISDDGLNITFTCGEGYTIDGVQSISCDTDGLGWELEYPNCTKCEDLAIPSNGNITLETDGSQTVAIYSCDVGYTLDGAAEPICQSDGSYTTGEQTCVSCPALPDVIITGGSVSLETNGYTTTAVYSCPTGYQVSGPEILTCNATGSWDNSPSTCVCETPDLPDGGSYTLSTDGLSVTFACDEGYTMNGVQQVICDTDGSGWVATFPNCTQCEGIAAPDGGNVTLVTNGTQSVAVYTCNVGSSLVGDASPECQTDGTWMSLEPNCVTCPTLPDVSISTGNVTIVTDGTTTTAVYNCPDGYDIKGSQTITCNTDGAWSSSPSDCVCNTPDATEGINFTFSNDSFTATFTCDAGYTMVGDQAITCGTDGSGWDVQQPNCTKCEDVPTPANGNLVLTSSGTQTIAVYTCGVGYTLDGDAAPTCGTDGTWTAYNPICVGCPEIANITSGTLNVTTDGQTTTAVYNCDSGYEMAGHSIITCLTNGSWEYESPFCFCQAPADPLFGNVEANTTTAVYSCDEGYILKGTSVRTCQDNGQGWTGLAPSCTTCNTLSDPGDGSFTLSSNGTVTIATFICGVGYSMNGTQTLVCLEDGSWSEEAPTCVECPTLVQPSSGSLTMSTDNIRTSAMYACESGYYIVGEGHLLCSSDGEWSADEPFCACNNLTAPDNGNVEIAVADGISSYTCDVGYSIDGVSTRTCNTDGTSWSHVAPICVGCPNITTTLDGDFELVTDGTATSVNFQCDNGASLDGPTTLTCQSDGTWTATQPTCVVCPTLTQPTSGNITMATDGVTSSVTYSCSENYEVVGDSTRECQTDGSWSGMNTTCVCTSPLVPANGTLTLVGDNLVAIYTCDQDFSLSGDSERVCQSDGSGWTGSDPSCVQCDPLGSPLNGDIVTGTNGTHTISTFICALGTSMRGQTSSVCLPDATWSSREPTCVTCPSLSNPNSGVVTTSTDNITTTAVYACASGYVISGENETTCLVDGSWSNPAPECLCEGPASLANGIVISGGRHANFECNVGYSLNGTSGTDCGNDGSGWSDQAPECVQCDDLSDLDSGQTSYTSTGVNTVAEFQCNVGTALNGNTILMCHINGSWNGSVPSCVECEDLVPPANGAYTMSSDGSTTSVQLQCNDGYEATGTTIINCAPDGTWSISQQSSCESVEEKADSLLGALIGVIVVSLVIIAVLSILLARFVYLYLQKRRQGEQYETAIWPFKENPKEHEYEELPLPPVRMKTSMAPINHQRHVLDTGGPFSTSPAPRSSEDNVAGNGAVPVTPLPIETHRSGNSVISFRRSTTTLTNQSATSLSHISISSPREKRSAPPSPRSTKSNGLAPIQDAEQNSLSIPDIKPSKLSPIPGHKQLMEKLNPPTPKRSRLKRKSVNAPKRSPSPSPLRSATPTVMSHSLGVANLDSMSLDSVSMVD